MENLNYNPKATREIVKSGVFKSSPFVLFDVGCSGGIDPLWRPFEPHLYAHAFDPRQGECARLQAAETNPNVRYYANAIGLPPGHEFLQRREACKNVGDYFDWYEETIIIRASMWRKPVPSRADAPAGPAEPAGPAVSAGPPPEPMRKVGLAEFITAQSIEYIDFFKIDTDGADLEALVSLEPALPRTATLGFLMECNYQGEWHDTSNSFHNIDRFMKRHGYMVYGMDVGRYSRAALPAPYVYPMFAQTRTGQPLQGDVVFLPDFTYGKRAIAAARAIPVTQVLKLVCLYELFNVPDCAVELIESCRDRVAEAIDPETVLDLLTPPLNGRVVSYREYRDYYANHHEELLPKPAPAVEEPPPPPASELGLRRRFLTWRR